MQALRRHNSRTWRARLRGVRREGVRSVWGSGVELALDWWREAEVELARQPWQSSELKANLTLACCGLGHRCNSHPKCDRSTRAEKIAKLSVRGLHNSCAWKLQSRSRPAACRCRSRPILKYHTRSNEVPLSASRLA